MPLPFLRKLRRRRRREDNNIVEPSPHPAVPKMRGSTPSTEHNKTEKNRHADAYKTDKDGAGCRYDAQPVNASKTDTDQFPADAQAVIEPSVDPSDQEPAFDWQDIEPQVDLNPPQLSEFSNYESSPAEKVNLLDMDTQRQTSAVRTPLAPPSHARRPDTIAHPSLTQQEQDRQSAFARAVQARLLGIPSTLPSYNEVSGAVIVDHEDLPHFLSPQEEEDRQTSLRRAVEERMLGLPRRTSFAWAQSPRDSSLPSYSRWSYT